MLPGTTVVWTCPDGFGLDGKDYGPQTQEIQCEESGEWAEPDWIFCLPCEYAACHIYPD